MKFFKSPVFIIIIAVIVGLAIGGYAYFGVAKNKVFDSKDSSNELTAQKMALTEQVSATGKIKSAQDVNLTFERGGKVTQVYVAVGDTVHSGQALVAIDSSDFAAQLLQAQANLKNQQAKLADLQAGTRPEEMTLQQIKVTNAQTALDDAKANLMDKIKSAYTTSDDAIRNKADEIFDGGQSTSPSISSFTINDFQLKSQIQSDRYYVVEKSLLNWETSLNSLIDSSDLSAALVTAQTNLSQIQSFMDKVAMAINNGIPNANTSVASFNIWKIDISTARNNLNAAVSTLTAAQEKLSGAQSALTIETQNLELKKAGSTSNQILAQQAQVELADAAVKSVQAQLSKAVIYAPINGTISSQEAKKGEIVSPNVPVVSLISNGKFEVEAYVSEADVAKVKVGNQSKITIDAYGNGTEFDAVVTSVDPAETVMNGVSTYKTTLQFTKEDDRVKSGMTANIKILAEEKTDVLAIPASAIITKGNDKVVLVDTGQTAGDERKVQIGIKGSNGFVEITSGLNEGERVFDFSTNQK